MGNITFGAQFNLAGSAFTKPTNGNNSTITFVARSPQKMVELHRSAAEIPNI